jgi:hypothetical protein
LFFLPFFLKEVLSNRNSSMYSIKMPF